MITENEQNLRFDDEVRSLFNLMTYTSCFIIAISGTKVSRIRNGFEGPGTIGLACAPK